jgi:arsenite oxidase small subunit
MTTEPKTTGGKFTRRAFLGGLGVAGGFVVGLSTGILRPMDDDDDHGSDGDGGSDGGDGGSGGGGSTIVAAEAVPHPKIELAKLGDLAVGDIVDFEYPTEGTRCSLFRLGKPAAGGLGPDQDIVAFATDCTHMGCPLIGLYKPEHDVLGPCSCHFTTFDLARRGMVVIGQATQNLPQIILEVEDDTIYAVGTLGIIYGFRDNLRDLPIVEGL